VICVICGLMFCVICGCGTLRLVRIRLNGEPHDLDGPLTILALLDRLGIDHRRVAVERNLVVIRRAEYGTTPVGDGDEIEVVNFVGGGATPAWTH
jgi:thiamine biosynthesis protein ThiS